MLKPLVRAGSFRYLREMDPITHLSAGAVIFQAVRDRLPKARFLLFFCLLLAILPDADILFFRSDPTFYLVHHRGFSHSLLFVALAAPVLAWGYRKMGNGTESWRLVTALSAGLLLTHIYQDLITSYGTQIFAPLSRARFGMDAVFIIDPVYTGLTLLCIATAAFWRRKRQLVALAAMLWIVAYPLFCAGLRVVAETRYRQELAQQGAPYDCLTVTTDALSPLFWKAILTNNGAYALESLDLRRTTIGEPAFDYQRPSQELLNRLVDADPFLETYFWFTAHPFYTEQLLENGGRELTFGDLRFQSPGPLMQSLFENGRTPFALTVRLNADGQVRQFIFHRSGKTFARSIME